MSTELTNLLPINRIRAVRRAYFGRLIIIASILLTLLMIVTGVLLVPAYIYARTQVRIQTEHLEAINAGLENSDEAELQSRLSVLSERVDFLLEVSETPTVSMLMKDVLAISRPGIKLSGFSYSSHKIDEQPNTLLVMGTASTRDRLRAFQLALLSAPFSVTADLPISAYAKDRDIAFTITVTLARP